MRRGVAYINVAAGAVAAGSKRTHVLRYKKKPGEEDIPKEGGALGVVPV